MRIQQCQHMLDRSPVSNTNFIQVDAEGVPISSVSLAIDISSDKVSTEWSGEKNPVTDKLALSVTRSNDDTYVFVWWSYGLFCAVVYPSTNKKTKYIMSLGN